MTRILDGLASLAAALIALVVTLPCAWFTIASARAGTAPVWAWAPAVVLALLGLVLGVAFLRKALRGIAPSRDKRR
jgi:hypothetical protein